MQVRKSCRDGAKGSPEILCMQFFPGLGCNVKKKLKFEDMSPGLAQPVYEHPPSKYTTGQIIRILLDPCVSKVCRGKPTSVSGTATYVVDVHSLQNIEDIKKDEFGIWRYSGSHPKYFKVYTEEDGRKSIEKCVSGASGSNVVCLRRLYCTHPSNNDFKRLICFLTGMLNEVSLLPTKFVTTMLTIDCMVQSLKGA